MGRSWWAQAAAAVMAEARVVLETASENVPATVVAIVRPSAQRPAPSAARKEHLIAALPGRTAMPRCSLSRPAQKPSRPAASLKSLMVSDHRAAALRYGPSTSLRSLDISTGS